MPEARKSVLVWDLPLRFFHWGFALTLTGSLALGLLGHKQGALFAWHKLLGLVAVALLVLRVVLGVAGASTARFSRMPVSLSAMGAYFRGILSFQNEERHPGHNPGSALAALAMFVIVPLLVATGLLGDRDPWEEFHEGLANALMVVIGLHLAGMIWHRVRRGENIALSMITGRRTDGVGEGLKSAHAGWALVCALAVGAWAGALVVNYDAASARVRLPLTNVEVRLGDGKGGSESHHGSERNRRHH